MESKLNLKPKLELKVSKNKLARLELVKQRAASRTNYRIARQLEEEELRKQEQAMLNSVDEMVAVVDEPIDTSPLPEAPKEAPDASKKGK